MPEPVEPITVSVKHAARLLGLSPWTVYKLCESKTIASVKHGNRILIRPEALDAYVSDLEAAS